MLTWLPSSTEARACEDMGDNDNVIRSIHLLLTVREINNSCNRARIRLANALLNTFGSNTSLTIGW